MQKDKKIEDKIIYRSIKFFFEYLGYDLFHEFYKKKWLDQVKAMTKQEKDVQSYISSFKFIYGNKSIGISEYLIRDSYYLLTGIRMSQKKINDILVSYYSVRENSAYVNATQIHRIILQNVKVNKKQFAMLLTNYILLRNGHGLITIYPSEIDKYNYSIKHLDRDWTYLYGFIVANEIHNRKANENVKNRPLKFTKDSFISKVLDYRKVLVNTYMIEHIYLYGSLSRGLSNPSSDVDLLIIMNDKEIPYYKKIELVSKCKKYLEKEMDIRIDLIDIKSGIKIFGTRGIEKSIKIF